MNGEQLRAFRERQGWSRKQLIEMINASLGTDYSLAKGGQQTVGRWEAGSRQMPREVESFLDSLEIETTFSLPGEAPLDGEVLESEPSSSRGGSEDSAPPPPDPSGSPQAQAGQLLLTTPGDSTLARVCEELWEMVATGVGLVGAATGSEALRRDGEIIHADKQRLGRAYGKLAETNATFRRMLTGMTTSGAWLEVGLVTGTTLGKVVRVHQDERLRREQAAQQAASTPEEDGGGDGSISGLVGSVAA